MGLITHLRTSIFQKILWGLLPTYRICGAYYPPTNNYNSILCGAYYPPTNNYEYKLCGAYYPPTKKYCGAYYPLTKSVGLITHLQIITTVNFVGLITHLQMTMNLTLWGLLPTYQQIICGAYYPLTKFVGLITHLQKTTVIYFCGAYIPLTNTRLNLQGKKPPNSNFMKNPKTQEIVPKRDPKGPKSPHDKVESRKPKATKNEKRKK